MRPSVPPLWLGVVVAASFIAVETLVPYPLERFTDGRALALVYVVGVVVVAIVWGLWLAAATSVVSALAFDYFIPRLCMTSPSSPSTRSMTGWR